MKKRRKKQSKPFKLKKDLKGNFTSLWVMNKGSKFHLGFSSPESLEPEFSICLNRNDANDLLIELCAFIMGIDVSELRTYTANLRLFLKNELDNFEDEQQSKLH